MTQERSQVSGVEIEILRRTLLKRAKYIEQKFERARQFDIDDDSTDTTVKNAQIELAWYIYKFFTEHEKRRAIFAQGVRDFKLSKWEEELEKPGFPDFINDMLSSELTAIGGFFPVASREMDT